MPSSQLYVLSCCDDTSSPEDLKAKRDALLDVYSLYLQTQIAVIREDVIRRAFDLHLKDPSFSFVV